MSAPVTLYHAPPSFYSQLARLALAEKGVDHVAEFVVPGPPLFETYTPRYMSMNPQGTVPVMVHVDPLALTRETLKDSRDILAHVDANFPGPALLPSESGERAAARERVAELYAISFAVLSYGDPKIRARGARVNAMRVANLGRRMARHPEMKEIYAAKLRGLESTMGEIGDPARMAHERASVQRSLNGLEAALGDGRVYLVGASYSLADLVWTVGLARLQMLALDPLAQRPTLAAWYERMRDRPSFVAADIWEQMNTRALAQMLASKLWPYALALVAVVVAVVLAVLTRCA